MAQSIAEHRAILEALGQQDAQAALTRMHDHIRNTARCAAISL
jgi:GntR family transcriptional regulator, transcriptional repressor for pyruvate dehydrogenase complex